MTGITTRIGLLKQLGRARDVQGFADALSVLLKDGTCEIDHILHLLRTQKVLTTFRDASLIESAFALTIGKIPPDLPAEAVALLKEHFHLCASVQRVFEHIDSGARAISGLRSEPVSFRIALLRRAEEVWDEYQNTTTAIDSEALTPKETLDVIGGLHQGMHSFCEAINTLFTANASSCSNTTHPITETDLEKLIALALQKESVLFQFDLYSYERISARVNRRSIIFGDPWGDELGLSSLWASQRQEADDLLGWLPYRRRYKEFLARRQEYHLCPGPDFSSFWEQALGVGLLDDALWLVDPLYDRAAAEVRQYFDLDQHLSLSTGSFTFRQLLRTWQCLVAASEITASWRETCGASSPSARRDSLPILPRSRLAEWIEDQTDLPEGESQQVLTQFTAQHGSRNDLFFRPVIPLGGDSVGLPSAFIRMSRIGRNILTIAVRESGFDQKHKGAKALLDLRQLFWTAGFEADVDIKLESSEGVLSDIDLAAFKDGVLFVVQSKVLILPDSAYDAWSVREKLNDAANQMNRCLTSLPAHLERLRRRLQVPDKETAVVPLLVTNAWQYTGARIQSFPTVDFSYFSMLLRGAEISYIVEHDDRIDVARRKLIAGRYPSGTELKVLIEDPLHRAMFEKPATNKMRLFKIGTTNVHIPFRQVTVPLKADTTESQSI